MGRRPTHNLSRRRPRSERGALQDVSFIVLVVGVACGVLLGSVVWVGLGPAVEPTPPLEGLPLFSVPPSASLGAMAPVSGPAPRLAAPVTAGPSPAWVNLTEFTNGSPIAVTGLDIAYDPAMNATLLSDGFWMYTYANATWTDLGYLAASNGVSSAIWTYDGADNDLLQFGGYWAGQTGGYWVNTTWAFANGTWTNLTPTLNASPPASGTGYAQMAYDASLHEVVLTLLTIPQVVGHSANLTAQTWTFSNDTWRNITATAGTPPSVVDGAMAYDARDGEVVEFGGLLLGPNGTEIPENSTWTFSSGHWSELSIPGPSDRTFDGLAYDPLLNAVVMYGGSPLGCGSSVPCSLEDTWEFAAGSWTNASSVVGPGPPNDPLVQGFDSEMTYDAADQYILLLPDDLPSVGQTWVLGSPPPYDLVSVDPATVEVGGELAVTVLHAGGAGPLTYDYLGLPTGCPSLNQTVVVCRPSAAGNFTVTATVEDLLGRTGRSSAAVSVVTGGPALASLTALPPLVHVGGSVQLIANTSGGVAPISYGWTGLPLGCVNDNETSLSCRPAVAGAFSPTFTVVDAEGVAASQSVALHVYAFPSAVTLTVVTPWVDLGDTLRLTAQATGGAPPLAFDFLGLPAGCASESGPWLNCTPTATGPFDVRVNVTDALGAGASSVAGSLHVQPDPTIVSLNATPSSATVGDAVTFTVATAGGTPPFGIAWSGLPPGCTGNGSSFACLPEDPGSYSVGVLVQDSLGHRANASVLLAVAPLPPAGTSLSPWLLAGGGIAAAAAVAVVVVVGVGRRRRRGPVEIEPPDDEYPDGE